MDDPFKTYYSYADHFDYDRDFSRAAGPTKTVVPGTYLDEIESDAKDTINQLPGWMSEFYGFYSRNIITISVLQWVILLIVLVKLQKKA